MQRAARTCREYATDQSISEAGRPGDVCSSISSALAITAQGVRLALPRGPEGDTAYGISWPTDPSCPPTPFAVIINCHHAHRLCLVFKVARVVVGGRRIVQCLSFAVSKRPTGPLPAQTFSKNGSIHVAIFAARRPCACSRTPCTAPLAHHLWSAPPTCPARAAAALTLPHRSAHVTA
jgi:hypothetical protein